ncbi:MAG: LamG-like jellyroll fold domain-containing protein [Candidatus Paceibacterota bacterium]|jgi:prepilin-type N-terminal cleavage/methylation domain-containing protein
MSKLWKQAFTLIELLVVIAIIGILSGLIVVSMGGITEKANIAKAQVFSNSLRNLLMLNIISEYKFDGNNNDSWGVNNGTAVGATLINTNCVFGSCLYFDGSDDYLTIPYSAMTSFRTFEFWFNTSRIDSGVRDWTKNALFFDNGDNTLDNEFAIHLYNGNTISAGWGSAGYENDVVFSGIVINSWYHIIVTVNDSQAKLYINGVLKDSDVADTQMKSYVSISPVPQFGGHPGSSYINFKGNIDNFRTYDYFMSASLAKQRYYSGLKNLLFSGQINGGDYKEIINLVASNE